MCKKAEPAKASPSDRNLAEYRDPDKSKYEGQNNKKIADNNGEKVRNDATQSEQKEAEPQAEMSQSQVTEAGKALQYPPVDQHPDPGQAGDEDTERDNGAQIKKWHSAAGTG